MSSINKVYRNFRFPHAYEKMRELNLTNFDWWYFMPESQVEERTRGLIERFPKRKLIPFARRDDCDDIACFELGKGEKIQIIHDFASEGYEQRKEYSSIWDWARDALDELIENEKQ